MPLARSVSFMLRCWILGSKVYVIDGVREPARLPRKVGNSDRTSMWHNDMVERRPSVCSLSSRHNNYVE